MRLILAKTKSQTLNQDHMWEREIPAELEHKLCKFISELQAKHKQLIIGGKYETIRYSLD